MSRDNPSKIFTSEEGYRLRISALLSDLSISCSHDTGDKDKRFKMSIVIPPKSKEESISLILYNTIIDIARSNGRATQDLSPLIPETIAETDKTDHNVRISTQLSGDTVSFTADAFNHAKKSDIAHAERFPVTMHFKRSALNDLLIPLVLAMHIAQHPDAENIYSDIILKNKHAPKPFGELPELAKLTIAP